MQEIVLRVEQHDRPLFGADRIVEQCQRSIQGTVQVQAGGNFGQDMQKRFGILLFALQLGSTLHHPHFQLARQALGLVEETSILDGDGRLVGEGAEDLQIIFRIDIRLDSSVQKAYQRSCR